MKTLGQGIYNLADAARLAKLRTGRVREWFRGKRGVDRRQPVFAGDYPPIEGDLAISFMDLIDVYIAGQLREHGVSLQTLRRVYERLQQDLGTKHAFCRKELLSDGKTVFMRGLDDKGREELAEVLTCQKVFPEVLLPFLKRIDYAKATFLALRWHIADQVVVDPAICFGKPIVAEVGIPTAILAQAYEANGHDSELVADWFAVHPGNVLAAVEFEKTLAA